MAPTAIEANGVLRPLLLKDLRNQCRARGLTPAGSRDSLLDRLQEHILLTGDMTIVADFNGDLLPSAVGNFAPHHADGAEAEGDSKENALDHTQAGLAGEDVSGHVKNNYVRPEGQNVGNFLTGRSSSRVLAPPGGFTNITFG